MTAAVLRGPAEISAPPKPKPSGDKRTFVAVGLALALASGGAGWIAWPKGEIATDDAYTAADASEVAPKVSGLVADVLVRRNQPVHRGQPLVRIDSEEFDARVEGASADLANANAGVLAARAAFSMLAAQERVDAGNVVAAQTWIASADAQRVQAQNDQARFERLADAGYGARAEVDRYRAAAVIAASAADRSRADLQVSRGQAAATAARAATLEANLAQAEAQVARAQAALDLARQDQSHALVISPIDGVIGDRQVEPGDYVKPGARLMTVAPLNAIYVTANFKETQVAGMTVGQAATVRLDALPGVALKGEVDSFAPGTAGSPVAPGGGTFTKEVRRVPVRIRLDPGQPGLERLRPGLSTTVDVRLTSGR
jgi:membrane fusion protein (multidrug efflux system)